MGERVVNGDPTITIARPQTPGGTHLIIVVVPVPNAEALAGST